MQKGVDYPGVSVVFFCHDGKGNYLMHKRSMNARDERGLWDCGGGGLEVGDQVLDRLRTEIREEYCTEAKEIEFLGYRDVHRDHEGKKTHWVALDFRVLVDRDKAHIGEPKKFDEFGWFKIDALPSPRLSVWEVFFEKYKAKFI